MREARQPCAEETESERTRHVEREMDAEIDQCIPRGYSDPFPDTIHEACGEHQRHRIGEREERLGHGRQTVADKVSGLRRPMWSLSRPDMSLTRAAVASATPSMTPTERALAPSTETRKTGRRLSISSLETSMNRLTRPRAQMPRGIARRPLGTRSDSAFIVGLNRPASTCTP